MPARHLALLTFLLLPAGAIAQTGAPSRPAENDCAWERMSDAAVGLAAWVQRCDFGFRRIGFEFQGASLAVRYSDGGGAEPLIDVFAMRPGEAADAAVLRIYKENTDAATAARCVVTPYADEPLPEGVGRFTFVPDAAYQAELDAAADPDEIPPPACGDWGEMPEGVQYFQTAANGANKLLFVRAGQEAPLFDEQTLQTLP